MTPLRPDAGVVHAKLAAIQESLVTLESVGTVDEHRLASDPVLTAAVERLLCRVVDLAVDINTHLVAAVSGRSPADYTTSFRMAEELGILPDGLGRELAPSVGMRNVIVHEYAAVDLGIVAAAVPTAMSMYRRYVAAVAGYVRARS
jgi:uncharacterized protein YutE (UPF0331/DUF86 family)